MLAVGQWLLDWLFPPRCPRCRAYTDTQGIWCPACYRRVVQVRKVPLDSRQRQTLRQVLLLCKYQDGMKKPLQALKYQGSLRYLPHIQSILAEQMPRQDLAQFDYFVPVPLHAEKIKARGFNQTEKIFYPWVLAHGFSWLDALIRTKQTTPQYALTRQERRRNMQRAFALKPGVSVVGKQILLVDDIFTTGATMEMCARTLRRGGAQTVAGLALAGDAEKNSLY